MNHKPLYYDTRFASKPINTIKPIMYNGARKKCTLFLVLVFII